MYLLLSLRMLWLSSSISRSISLPLSSGGRSINQSSAVSYSYAGTEILLFAQAEGDKAKVMIKNHGKTIAPDKLEHIFEQFYRADAARSSATGGAGLGLAITKEIVELHGGTVTAASANESTIFIVVLPYKK